LVVFISTCFANGYLFYLFLADRTNGSAYATVLRPSVVVCDVMNIFISPQGQPQT